MSDILKVTTPLINKNQAIPPKTGLEPLTPFNIQDPSRVVRTHNQSELMQQNNGMIDNGEPPVLLMNLLKDPAVAVSYLKNIFLLEEIFKLLPANNKTVTQEIEQVFQQLIMQADDVKNEMVRQEHASTAFKGGLFDFLRNMSEVYREAPETQVAIANLLKSINNMIAQEDILNAVSNSLEFLKGNLTSSKSLAEKLDQLLEQFRQKDTSFNFQSLKEQTLDVMKEIENSLLFSPKLSKVLSIVVYNLSRYNNNLDYFNESAFRMRQFLTADQRQEYVPLLEKFTSLLRKGTIFRLQREESPETQGDSKVMEALVKLIHQQAGNENISATDSVKIDKILYSLLSSPCNFTPLLHFIVPMMHDQMRAFAEIWINPNSDEKDMPKGVKSGQHFLLVIDVESIGRFEAEFFVHDEIVDFYLFCPPGYQEKYEGMMKNLPKVMSEMPYRLGETRLATLERSRSLMDVFKSLPYKRVGVDVKI